MTIHGNQQIGYSLSGIGKQTSQALNPVTGKLLPGEFVSAEPEEVNRAVEMACTAFETYRRTTPAQRADFLEAMADEILALGDPLIERATAESALPPERITGERGRTVGQLKSFADLLREGSWLEATIETAQPDRQPVPKTDLRRMLEPMGPITVFAASNFPLAFSVAGGDTASALAGGNPVIVKAHSGHPGTSELVAGAIVKAAKRCEMPNGVFSLLHGPGRTVGQALVRHPGIKAAGFTGSAAAGRLLFDLACSRPEPIPFFAEMGSINPVFVAPQALSQRGDEIAQQYAGSITMGVGQFCTNPGLIVGLAGDSLDRFITRLGEAIEQTTPGTMLNQTVFNGYQHSYEQILQQPGIQTESLAASEADPSKLEARPTVTSVDGKTFLENPKLHQEVFGPFSMVVKCEDETELLGVITGLEGQLTATVMAEPEDMERFGNSAVEQLKLRCGRMVFNGVPTGVEVCSATHHGGPYPACTDSRFTSVGTFAIKRFVRPVAYQDWPDAFLPDELKNGNPLNIWRLVDGEWKKGALA